MIRRVGISLFVAIGALLALGAGSAGAVIVQATGGALLIQGDSAAPNADDLITITDTGTAFRINEAGPGAITAGSGCTSVDPDTAECLYDPADPAPPASPFRPIQSYNAFLLAGEDRLINQTTLPTDDEDHFGGTFGVELGEGNDSFEGGPGEEWIAGGGGNDQIEAAGGDDHLTGGVRGISFDNINEEDPLGDDLLSGGPGVDTATFEDRVTPVTVTLDQVANDGTSGEADNVQTEIVIGGRSTDTITGDAEENLLIGGLSRDVINGQGGSDEVLGGPGNDDLLGGPASDGLFGGSGDDNQNGGAGPDHHACGSGTDTAALRSSDTARADCERTGARFPINVARMRPGGQAFIRVLCPAAEGADCVGEVTLRIALAGIADTTAYSIPAGTSQAVEMNLSTEAQRIIERRGLTAATAYVSTELAFGTSVHRQRFVIRD